MDVPIIAPAEPAPRAPITAKEAPPYEMDIFYLNLIQNEKKERKK